MDSRTAEVRSETEDQRKGHDHCRECKYFECVISTPSFKVCRKCDGHSQFVSAKEATHE